MFTTIAGTFTDGGLSDSSLVLQGSGCAFQYTGSDDVRLLALASVSLNAAAGAKKWELGWHVDDVQEGGTLQQYCYTAQPYIVTAPTLLAVSQDEVVELKIANNTDTNNFTADKLSVLLAAFTA